jgi:hypothetical protein
MDDHITLIEEAAKMREDLTWAMKARKTVTSDHSTLFQSRLRKSPGGGQRHPPAPGVGRGRGTGGKHGSGKGKGPDKKVKWDKGHAEAGADSTDD